MLRALFLCTSLICCKGSDYEEPKSYIENVAVDSTSLQVRHGPIGIGEDQKQATYVLVDVKNNWDKELTVQVGGQLFAGKEAKSKLRLEMLRIPPRSKRTFAPVPDPIVHHPDVTGAEIYIKRAFIDESDQKFTIDTPVLHPFAGKTLVKFWAHNLSGRRVHANILASYRDVNGTVILRKAASVLLRAKQRAVIEIPGPTGAKEVDVYLGERVYP